MELILEVVNRAGRVLERHRFTRDRIAIGRAYDSDLILTDETVSPRHAEIVTDAAGNVLLRDLGSINGTRCERGRVGDEVAVHSGDEFTFGRARVRVYTPEHPITETVRLGGLDGLVNRFGSVPVLLILLVVVMVLTSTELWLHSYSGVKGEEIGIAIFGIVTASALVATFFAVIGRVAKHEGHFYTQLGIVLAYLLGQTFIVHVYEILLYNSLNSLLCMAVGLAASFALLCVTLWFALHVATNLTSPQRWRFALLVAGVMLSLSLFPEIASYSEFAKTPEYVKEIKPPMLRFNGGNDAEIFLDGTNGLYGEVAHDDDA